MKVSFDAPDEWEKLLDEEAHKDGHSNRAAVIRKIVTNYFAEKVAFCSPQNQKSETERKAETK